jgi:hypothetical protein
METNQGNEWHAGDGGLLARFSDGTVTDSTWSVQSFYIAPLEKPGDVVEKGDVHDTPTLGRVYPAAKVPACRERCFAVHYPIPNNWAAPNFDDSHWPKAVVFTDEDVGVDHVPASLSRSVHGSAVDLVHQSGVRQSRAGAEDGSLNASLCFQTWF